MDRVLQINPEKFEAKGGLIRKGQGILPKRGTAFSLKPDRGEMAVFSKSYEKADSGDYRQRLSKKGAEDTRFSFFEACSWRLAGFVKQGF